MNSSPFGGIPRNWKHGVTVIFWVQNIYEFPLRGDP